MKPSTLVSLLCTSAAAVQAAIPSSAHRNNLNQRSQQHQNQQPRLLHTLSPSHLSAQTKAKTLSQSLSLSQAAAESVQGGAIFTLPTNKSTITSITGTFTIPHALVPTTGPTANGSASTYAASFHLSIDGFPSSSSSSAQCNTGGAALRAGIDIFYDAAAGGEERPFAWYQYAPSSSAVGFANFSAAPGDTLKFTLSISTSTSSGAGAGAGAGVVTVENFGPGRKATKPIQTATATVVGGGQALCGRQAGWVVEDFPLAGLPDFPVALADFGTVTFGALGVGLDSGKKVGEKEFVAGTGLVDINLEAQGGRLTDCKLVRGGGGGGVTSQVRCARVVGN
ncbi:concanavalin A-like lectin/glucanase domain-containing protein [Cercophora scortea]|uniref:Concanavalin A-like lectin/glucanase domain-containing protein n=1 Tax=Cercophora scortea TaxID=314031 RepID=A0AAE0IME6_9PEZI|nr:concanavalin A-like lectin/glucanase domain-containing protein [Cercophora scortea]